MMCCQETALRIGECSNDFRRTVRHYVGGPAAEIGRSNLSRPRSLFVALMGPKRTTADRKTFIGTNTATIDIQGASSPALNILGAVDFRKWFLSDIDRLKRWFQGLAAVAPAFHTVDLDAMRFGKALPEDPADERMGDKARILNGNRHAAESARR